MEIQDLNLMKGFVKVDKMEYKSEDELALSLYAESKFKVAISDSNLAYVKQNKRKRADNYLRYLQKETVFSLDIILDK